MTTWFDPLVELYGLWTTELAERYLPIDGAPPAKYECVDGRLIMSPRGGSANSHATGELYALLREPARTAAHVAYSRINMVFDPQRWIEPDLAVLRHSAKNVTWVPAEQVLMSVEFDSRWDRRALCAAAGVPYFLRVEITDHEAHLELLRLDDSGRYVVQAKALAGQEFRTELPYPLSFDPAVLLES